MSDATVTSANLVVRILSTLAWPLKRLRKFVTQRAENELRAEITALSMRLTASQAELREQERKFSVLLAGSHAWRPPVVAANERPRFSIVMPTRNRRALIGDAIDSVLAQTFADWELLILDDGSSDGTEESLRGYLADPRIRYRRGEARGSSAARNAGLKLARGELVAYLDTDNAWFPGFLADMHAAFAEDGTMQSAYAMLVTDAKMHAGPRILWEPFDYAALEQGNYIDLNVFVHRRELADRYGLFDEALPRLNDWDLILRYVRGGGCRRILAAGAFYRSRVYGRESDTHSYGDNWFRIQCKLRAVLDLPRAPRVLYAVWHYPQLSETYIETEILGMRRFGVDIEVWSDEDVAVSYPVTVTVRRGTLEQAIADFAPDVVHAHWVNCGCHYAPIVQAAGLPLTVRSHSFEINPESLAQLLKSTALRRLVLFPSQQANLELPDSRIAFAKSAFDTQLFVPATNKNRRMVLRTTAALPSKDLALFLQAAKRLPDYRFVLIACTSYQREGYVEELKRLKAELDSPAELYFDMPRERTAEFVREAGIYLHTAHGPASPDCAPIGMPISIAEAMATGAYVIARDLPELRDYIGPAGAVYADVDQACALIRASGHWNESAWHRAESQSIDRAFLEHADEIVLRPLYDFWVRLMQERASA